MSTDELLIILLFQEKSEGVERTREPSESLIWKRSYVIPKPAARRTCNLQSKRTECAFAGINIEAHTRLHLKSLILL